LIQPVEDGELKAMPQIRKLVGALQHEFPEGRPPARALQNVHRRENLMRYSWLDIAVFVAAMVLLIPLAMTFAEAIATALQP
jgi:hypothetical protein